MFVWVFGRGVWPLLNHRLSLASSITKETASQAEWGCMAEASVTPHHRQDSSNTPVCSVSSPLVFFSDHLTDQNKLIVSTHSHCFLCNTYATTPMETLMWQNKRSQFKVSGPKYQWRVMFFFFLSSMSCQWQQQGCWFNRSRHSGFQREEDPAFPSGKSFDTNAARKTVT